MSDTSWYPANYYIQPHYRTMPGYLRVVDFIAPELMGDRREFWLKSRRAGLSQWEAAGLTLSVTEGRLGGRQNRANRVTIAFAGDVPLSLGAWHWFEDPSVGPVGDGHDWIHFNPAWFEAQFWTGIKGPTVYRVAHEFGHSLGFGHGGDGIMDETPDHARVNAEETAAAKAYWGFA